MIGHGGQLESSLMMIQARACLLYQLVRPCANPAKEQDEQTDANGSQTWLID
jgi:hypothetical protein